MSFTLANARQTLLSIGSAALLVGCAATPMGPTVQVMPGPGKSLAAFQMDNDLCKGYAADQVKGQADSANQRAVGAAILTTALGAGLGAATGGLSYNAGGGAGFGAAAGLAAGSAIGANNSAMEQMGIQARYDMSYSQCMYSKGERVPGFAPPRVVSRPRRHSPLASGPVNASAPPANWVAPSNGPAPAASAPSGWVAPSRTQ